MDIRGSLFGTEKGAVILESSKVQWIRLKRIDDNKLYRCLTLRGRRITSCKEAPLSRPREPFRVLKLSSREV